MERARGPVWYAKYRLPDGRQVQKKIGPAWTGRGRPAAGYVTKRLAEAWLREVLGEARHGTLPGQVRTGVTFADAAAEWLRYVEFDRARKPSTMSGYRAIVRSHLLPAFAELPIESITTSFGLHDLLTAGHCLAESIGQPGRWYTYRRFSGQALQIGQIEDKLPAGPSSGYVLDGPADHYPPSGQGDFGVIHVDNSATTGVPSKHTYVYVPGASGVAPANDTYWIKRAADPPKNWTICGSSGITLSTGNHMACGHVTHLHRTTHYTNEHNQDVGNLDESNACMGTGGASGSPLYLAHTGLGIDDARFSDCDILFSPLANALNQLGVDLY